MATDYGPEIKAAIKERGASTPSKRPRMANPAHDTKGDPGDTPADMKRDLRLGIKEDSPRDTAIDARNAQNTAPPRMQQHAPADMHHINAAAGIAHAILANRPTGGGY